MADPIVTAAVVSGAVGVVVKISDVVFGRWKEKRAELTMTEAERAEVLFTEARKIRDDLIEARDEAKADLAACRAERELDRLEREELEADVRALKKQVAAQAGEIEGLRDRLRVAGIPVEE